MSLLHTLGVWVALVKALQNAARRIATYNVNLSADLILIAGVAASASTVCDVRAGNGKYLTKTLEP